MPDERFAGIVAKSRAPPRFLEPRWGNPNLKVYNTDIHITDKLPDVKPGVSAKAEIIITNVERRPLRPHPGRHHPQRPAGGLPRPRQRRTAIPAPSKSACTTPSTSRSLSGVKEGDRVLLAPPFDTQSKDLTGEILAPDEKARIKFTNTTPPAGSTRINREDVLKRYDRDKDGKLNDQEKAAMERAFGDRIAQPAGPGTGNGNRSQEGRPGGAGNRPGRNSPTDAPSESPRTGGNRPNRSGGGGGAGAGGGGGTRERPPSP
jgi:hypothetical protein